MLILSMLLLVTQQPEVTQYSPDASLDKLTRKPIILKQYRQTFLNENCERRNTCDLKRIEFLAEDYKIKVEQGYHFAVRFIAEYQTKKVADIRNYVFVQYIRGCKYVVNEFQDGRHIFFYDTYFAGQQIPFRHVDWTIDTDIEGVPIYTANTKDDLFYYLYWNTERGSFNLSTQRAFSLSSPMKPSVYMSDRAGKSAFVMGNTSINTAVELQTCLYKIGDILQVSEAGYLPPPIQCFAWNNIFIFNENSGFFERRQTIPEVCTAPEFAPEN